MHIFKVYAILISFTVCRANYLTKDIYLHDYGNYPVNWFDEVLILYVTLINDGDCPVMVSVKMIQCCEQLFTSNDMHCNHLHFYGSQKQLERARNANFTLIYPNIYPYNRKGKCKVAMTITKNQSIISKYKLIIPFDTTKTLEDITALRSSVGMLKLCESQDEDPLDLCAPVDCHMKYQGFRSLFDTIKRQCVSIPICDGKPNNGNSSNIVYDPYSNKCTALTDQISKSDIDCILNETEDKKIKKIKTNNRYQSNIRCHHGKMDEIKRSCICDDGWTSIQNWNFPIISTVPIHMCTVRNIKSKTFIGKILFKIKNLKPKNIYRAILLSIIWFLIIQIIITCFVLKL
ncbi:uncharacterized protein LOC126550930 isoform X1 [Aphis gossypii]|uniref:uncharacterized protein LOC126550930 isoform X1 n=2 Tax=Aphis gossypii TaxID=80765 RepID=UPI002158A5ED|nr:uncharacterized protein LOC126550930 isoform X1 [Aphis gossypii]